MAKRTEDELLAEVLAAYDKIDEGREKDIIKAAIKHIYAFARDIDLSHDEWLVGIDFMTRVGQICSDKRQEFILLSDLLGLSALVELQHRKAVEGETPGSVAGPFHVNGSPFIEIDGDMDLDQVPGGQRAYVSGIVRDLDGTPIAGAELDIWQTAPNALYAVQDETQSEDNLRGRQITDENGKWGFYTAKPVPYSVPRDGPCGYILDIANRHGMRTAHIHVGIKADGYKPLVTEVFPHDDPNMDTDTVFGACEELVMEYVENTDPKINAELVSTYDFVLRKPSATA